MNDTLIDILKELDIFLIYMESLTATEVINDNNALQQFDSKVWNNSIEPDIILDDKGVKLLISNELWNDVNIMAS